MSTWTFPTATTGASSRRGCRRSLNSLRSSSRKSGPRRKTRKSETAGATGDLQDIRAEPPRACLTKRGGAGFLVPKLLFYALPTTRKYRTNKGLRILRAAERTEATQATGPCFLGRFDRQRFRLPSCG